MAAFQCRKAAVVLFALDFYDCAYKISNYYNRIKQEDDMEIRQLEYFIEVCRQGSFNQAAESLYTTQPNVSKVIGGLEQELGRALFERTSKGIKITPYGETIQEYARNILKNVGVINSMRDESPKQKFSLSTYSSNMVARLLTDFYQYWQEKHRVEYQEGSVEEISSHVAKGISEFGIVYVAQKQLRTFQHILSHKKLRFEPLAVKEICVYVGPNNPFFEKESVEFSQLSNLRFVRGMRDFFSMEHHLSQVSLGVIQPEKLNYAVLTNSDHMTLNLLRYTDVCSLGIDFMYPSYKQYEIKNLKINNCEPFLVIGSICPEESQTGEAAEWFLKHFQKMLTQKTMD